MTLVYFTWALLLWILIFEKVLYFFFLGPLLLLEKFYVSFCWAFT